MTTYVLRDGALVEKSKAPPRVSHYIASDYKPFRSPLDGHPMIDGKRELRESLARNQCRLVERGEWYSGGTVPDGQMLRQNLMGNGNGERR